MNMLSVYSQQILEKYFNRSKRKLSRFSIKDLFFLLREIELNCSKYSIEYIGKDLNLFLNSQIEFVIEEYLWKKTLFVDVENK